MKRFFLAAAAAAAITSPAAARDGSGYAGIEGGILIPRNMETDLTIDFDGDDVDYDNGLEVNFGRGLDLDLIAGYDFGMIRAEAELGWKRANIDEILVDESAIADLEEFFGRDGYVEIVEHRSLLFLPPPRRTYGGGSTSSSLSSIIGGRSRRRSLGPRSSIPVVVLVRLRWPG